MSTGEEGGDGNGRDDDDDDEIMPGGVRRGARGYQGRAVVDSSETDGGGEGSDVDMSGDRDNEVTRTGREVEDAGSGDGDDGDEDMVMDFRRRTCGHEISVVSGDVLSDEANEGVDSIHGPRRSARQRDRRAKDAHASALGGCVDDESGSENEDEKRERRVKRQRSSAYKKQRNARRATPTGRRQRQTENARPGRQDSKRQHDQRPAVRARREQRDAQADARARRQELRAAAAAREKARAYRQSLESMDIETRVHNSFTVDPDKALMHFWRMSGGPRGECLHEDDFVEDMLERTIPVTLKDTAARIKSCREQLSPDGPMLNCGVCCRSEMLPMKFDPGRPAHQQQLMKRVDKLGNTFKISDISTIELSVFCTNMWEDYVREEAEAYTNGMWMHARVTAAEQAIAEVVVVGASLQNHFGAKLVWKQSQSGCNIMVRHIDHERRAVRVRVADQTGMKISFMINHAR